MLGPKIWSDLSVCTQPVQGGRDNSDHSGSLWGSMIQHAHSWRVSCALVFCASLVAGMGCSATQAAYQGTGGSGFADGTAEHGPAPTQRGDAIAQAAPCGPRDSTVSCCLKQHPGDYARCGALEPTNAPTKAPSRTPKQEPRTDPPPALPPPTSAAPPDKRKREQQCREYYHQCIELGGEYEKRGQHGRSICKSCYDTCNAEGYWPPKVNDFECLGGF